MHYIKVSSSPRLTVYIISTASDISIFAFPTSTCNSRLSTIPKWQFSASKPQLLSFSCPSFPCVSVNAPTQTGLRCSQQSTLVVPRSRGEWQRDAPFAFALMMALARTQQIRPGHQRTDRTSLISVDILPKHSPERTAILPASLATQSRPRMKRTFQTGES